MQVDAARRTTGQGQHVVPAADAQDARPFDHDCVTAWRACAHRQYRTAYTRNGSIKWMSQVVSERSRTSHSVAVKKLSTGKEADMIKMYSFAFARASFTGCVLGFLSAQCQAAIIVSSPFPHALVPGGTYQAAALTTYLTPSGPTFLSSVGFFDIFTEHSTDSGLNALEDATVGGLGGMELPLPIPHTEPLTYTGTALANVTGGASTEPPTGTFDTELLSLSLTGSTGLTFMPVLIRESPTLPSAGQTTVTGLGGGSYEIDSFFDVFTELSLDGGVTWTPSTTSTRFDLGHTTVPVPAATWFFLSGLAALGGVAHRKTGRARVEGRSRSSG